MLFTDSTRWWGTKMNGTRCPPVQCLQAFVICYLVGPFLQIINRLRIKLLGPHESTQVDNLSLWPRQKFNFSMKTMNRQQRLLLSLLLSECKFHGDRNCSLLFTAVSPLPRTVPGTLQLLSRYLLYEQVNGSFQLFNSDVPFLQFSSDLSWLFDPLWIYFPYIPLARISHMTTLSCKKGNWDFILGSFISN